MTSLPGYDNWLLRGSGAFSTDEDVTLQDPCDECGATEGTLFVDDWGSASIECENGHEQPEPEPDEPEFDDEAYYAAKYGE